VPQDADGTGPRTEFTEELGSVPAGCPVLTTVDDHGGWAYHTVVMEVEEPASPQRGDGEGTAYRWCAPGEIGSLRLHPGIAATWPRIRSELDTAAR
jgi:hypothetical protein